MVSAGRGICGIIVCQTGNDDLNLFLSWTMQKMTVHCIFQTETPQKTSCQNFDFSKFF